MQTDKNGQPMYVSPEGFKHFFKQFPNAKFEFKVQKISGDQRKGLIAHYKNEVVPQCRIGFRDLGDVMTDDQVDQWLLYHSPIMMNGRRFSDSDVSDGEISDHIDFCIKFAAEHLHIAINKPE